MTGRVVHMTSVHRPDDARIFLKECRTLAAAGYEVHLVAPTASNSFRDGVSSWGTPRPTSGSRLARMTSTVLHVCRRARALKPDLYHFHDPEIMPAALLFARLGSPVVYDVHEDLVATIPDKAWIHPSLRAPVADLVARIEPAAANQLAAAVTATPAIEERFAGCKCDVVTVNNYPRLTEFQDVPQCDVGGNRAVCYVGGLTEIRGIEVMIEAIAKTDVRLLLAGSFEPDSFGDRMRALAGWARVEALGQVGRSELTNIFGRATAGIVVFQPAANHVRSQPTKLFEYMAAGLPVVASNFPLWHRIIESHRCGICVNPEDSDALAEAIRWLASHPVEARQMGENGRRAVRSVYNWEAEGRKLTALYERILGDPPQPTRRADDFAVSKASRSFVQANRSARQ